MIKVLLPSMAAFKGNLETMRGLLEKVVPKEYGIGLEVIGKVEHFQDSESLGKIADNVHSLAKGAHIIIHGFSGLTV